MKTSEKIYILRKKLGLSQDELAEKLSVSRQAVSKWETGDSVPEPANLLSIAKIFSVSTDYLLDESQQEYIPPHAKKNIDIADRIMNKTEAFFKKYDWLLGVLLLLLGLWRIISAAATIATFSGTGAFGVFGAAAFLPLAFQLLIGIALSAAGIILINKLRKKKDE